LRQLNPLLHTQTDKHTRIIPVSQIPKVSQRVPEPRVSFIVRI